MGVPDSLSQFSLSVKEPKRGDELPTLLLGSGRLGCVVCWDLSRQAGEDREEDGNICRARAGETDRALGQVHKQAVSPGSGHPQASLNKDAHFRRKGLSVVGPSSQEAERQVDQTRGAGSSLSKVGQG